MLQIWDAVWSLDEEQCPCDLHFTQWLEQEAVKDRTIFHFGSGIHHLVGLRNLALGAPNRILAITASPKEHAEFVRLAIENATLSRDYMTYFGDIYLLNVHILPQIDIATLFHLAEFRGDSQDAYGGLTDEGVVETLLDVMPSGGLIGLFTGSFAYDKALAVMEKLVGMGRLEPAFTFKSLSFYTKR